MPENKHNMHGGYYQHDFVLLESSGLCSSLSPSEYSLTSLLLTLPLLACIVVSTPRFFLQYFNSSSDLK